MPGPGEPDVPSPRPGPGAPTVEAAVEGGSWLTGNLRVLSAVSFLQDTATEMLYPVMPVFLTGVLGAPVAVVGAVEGVAEAVASATKLVAGRIADRWRRRPLVGLGYGLAAVGKAVIAVAGAWPVVLVGRAVDRLGKGIRGAPRDALLVDGVPPWARGRAFGLHRAADTAGAVAGPLIGLAAYAALDHRIRPLLFIAVIPAALSALLVVAVRESAAPSGPAPGGPVERVPGPLPAGLWRVVAVLVAFGLVNFPDALLLVRAEALGLSVAGVILAYVTYNAAYALASFPAGVLADRWGPQRVYAVGLACFAVCYLGLGVVDSPGWVWPLFVVYGGFTAATDGVGKAWVSRLVPGSAQGRAQGWFQGLTGGAVLIAGLWAGFAWGGDGRVPLVVSGVVAAGVAAALAVAPPLERPRA